MTVEQFQRAYQTDPRGPSRHGLMRAVLLAQVDFELVRLWELPNYLEACKWMRRIKVGFNQQCPRCVAELRKRAAARYARYLIRTGGRPRRHKGTRRLRPWQPSRTVLAALAWDAARQRDKAKGEG